MILFIMLIGGVRGKDTANGVVFVWPCGVNTDGSIGVLYTKDYLITLKGFVLVEKGL